MVMIQRNSKYYVLHTNNVYFRPINPQTGTRFKKYTVQQLAFDKLVECLDNKICCYKKLLKIFNGLNKKKGCKENLNSNYLHLILASHPDFFEIDLDKNIHIIKYPHQNDDEKLRRLRSIKMKEKIIKEDKKLKNKKETVKAIGNFSTIDGKHKIDNNKGNVIK